MNEKEEIAKVRMKAKETNNLNVTDFCIQKCKIRNICINCILYTKSCYIKNVSKNTFT